MIRGAHAILYSRDAETDRAFLRDVLGMPAGVRFEGPITDEGWGRLSTLVLPGGGRVGLYEARHPTASDA